MLKTCKRNCNCYARDKYDNCHILNNTYFRGACPFAKPVEQVRAELKYCASRIKYDDYKYQLMIKEVYDTYLYKTIFKVGDDLK